jgi:hypothetical protein
MSSFSGCTRGLIPTPEMWATSPQPKWTPTSEATSRPDHHRQTTQIPLSPRFPCLPSLSSPDHQTPRHSIPTNRTCALDSRCEYITTLTPHLTNLPHRESCPLSTKNTLTIKSNRFLPPNTLLTAPATSTSSTTMATHAVFQFQPPTPTIR